MLKTKGVVVCLHASLETILARTSRQRNRPLLVAENPEERIRTLFAAREPIYRQSGTVILTDSRPLVRYRRARDPGLAARRGGLCAGRR
jgi:shikimate kinase